MSSIKKTKKSVKKTAAGIIWVEHARFWMMDSVNPANNYRGISRFFFNVDISELSKITGFSKERLKKYIMVTMQTTFRQTNIGQKTGRKHN